MGPISLCGWDIFIRYHDIERSKWAIVAALLPTAAWCRPYRQIWKMNLFVTHKIYDIGYKTEMMSKECNAGDPLETPGGLYHIVTNSHLIETDYSSK